MEITLNDVLPFIWGWTGFAFALFLTLCYHAWKLIKAKPKTSEAKKEQDKLAAKYAVYLFSGMLIYAAVLCILYYIGAPIKQTKSLILLLLFFAMYFILIVRNYRNAKHKSL